MFLIMPLTRRIANDDARTCKGRIRSIARAGRDGAETSWVGIKWRTEGREKRGRSRFWAGGASEEEKIQRIINNAHE
jgi:hypothetical protein